MRYNSMHKFVGILDNIDHLANSGLSNLCEGRGSINPPPPPSALHLHYDGVMNWVAINAPKGLKLSVRHWELLKSRDDLLLKYGKCSDYPSRPSPTTVGATWKSGNELKSSCRCALELCKKRGKIVHVSWSNADKHGYPLFVLHTKIQEVFFAYLRWNSREKEKQFTERRSKRFLAN